MYVGPAYDPFSYGGQGPTADVYDFIDRWPEGEVEEEVVDVGGAPVRILRTAPRCRACAG